ncbi:store-operated calcium entry regulator STIMATE-like [Daphnia carinata]|uniref:store-operated calcium entry regulator STIMATE-like n=1 Tax=Daphnia carinata TaxID=120202 RepID=UPI00257DC1E2|nr:store-operated calcium entry regulator STIMATE-like [Daphnia carinata]
MNLGTELIANSAVTVRPRGSPLCSKDALTDDFGWTVQAVLACLAFTCLVLKRFCEPARRRRSWLVWFYDTSKQGLGSLVIHMANIYLATLFQGDPCTWYIVSFLLDSSVGLLVIYACIRLTVKLADKWKWQYLYFGEYGNPASAKAWAAQSGVYMGIMVVEKVLITILVQLEFWDKVRDLILSPITDPKVAITVVLLVIPFFVNVLMFWVTDNFLMKKPKRGRKRAVRYQRVVNNNSNLDSLPEDSDALLSGDEDLLDSTEEPATTPLAFKNVDELLNVNRRNNSVV